MSLLGIIDSALNKCVILYKKADEKDKKQLKSIMEDIVSIAPEEADVYDEYYEDDELKCLKGL